MGKVQLGLIGLLIGALLMTSWLLQRAQASVGQLRATNAELTQTIELVAKREQAALEKAMRLEETLEARRVRAQVLERTAAQLREEIDALSSSNILSDDASRVLQQIYDRHRTM